MKKNYNRMTTNDMPMDSSFMPVVEQVMDKKPSKNKITARGSRQATANKSKSKSKSSNQNNSLAKDIGVDKNLKSKLNKEKKDLIDLEKLNEENIKAYRFKSRRNRVVIITLAVLLAIVIAVIATYLVIAKLESNCNLYAHGAKATFIVNDDEMSRFRSPSNLQGNARLEFDVKLKIEEGGMFNIKFVAKCFQKGQLMENTLIYDADELFYEGALYNNEDDNYYYSRTPISGNQTIRLCGGVIIDHQYEHSLNVDNFKLEFHVYLDKI